MSYLKDVIEELQRNTPLVEGRGIKVFRLKESTGTPPRVFHGIFGSTAEAYGAIQTGQVNRFDVVVVEPEGVVGIADAWPVAVTEKHGEFHQMSQGHDLTELFPEASIRLATAEAEKRGFPLHDPDSNDEYEDDGQPDEYTEWQDYMGGDDWDQGQYDD